jgi:hypothetical protein
LKTSRIEKEFWGNDIDRQIKKVSMGETQFKALFSCIGWSYRRKVVCDVFVTIMKHR